MLLPCEICPSEAGAQAWRFSRLRPSVTLSASASRLAIVTQVDELRIRTLHSESRPEEILQSPASLRISAPPKTCPLGMDRSPTRLLGLRLLDWYILQSKCFWFLFIIPPIAHNEDIRASSVTRRSGAPSRYCRYGGCRSAIWKYAR